MMRAKDIIVMNPNFLEVTAIKVKINIWDEENFYKEREKVWSRLQRFTWSMETQTYHCFSFR